MSRRRNRYTGVGWYNRARTKGMAGDVWIRGGSLGVMESGADGSRFCR